MRPSPGAEVLGGDVLVGGLAQILVHLVRPDRVLLALVVEILEQLVAGQIAAPLDDAREATVGDNGTACVRARRARPPADVRSDPARSRRRSRLGVSPATGCVSASLYRAPARRRACGSRSRGEPGAA